MFPIVSDGNYLVLLTIAGVHGLQVRQILESISEQMLQKARYFTADAPILTAPS